MIIARFFKRFLFKKNMFKAFFSIFTILMFITSNNFVLANTLNVFSKNAILMDYETGQILYSKGAKDKIYPASTTKILTAILTIEKGNILDCIVASDYAISSTPAGSSTAGIKVGEVMSVKDYLYCVLMKSANEGANVLAEYVSGNTKDFVTLMNEKVKELGCKNTNFTNPHGFHDNNHYTTPEDMMIILRYAMKNNEFREIMETKYYTVKKTNMTDTTRDLVNTNRLLFTEDEMGNLSNYYNYAVGGKTGYTIEAERTFVGYAKKDNKLILAGTFGAMNVGQKDARYLDCITLFEYGFNNYNQVDAIKKENYTFEILDNVDNKKYTVGLAKNVTLLINEKENIKTQYSFEIPAINNITNLAINQDIGSINITILNGDLELVINKPLILLNIENINNFQNIKQFALSNNVLKAIRFVAIILLIILLIFLLIYYILYKKNPNRKFFNKHYNKVKKYLSSEDDISFNKKD